MAFSKLTCMQLDLTPRWEEKSLTTGENLSSHGHQLRGGIFSLHFEFGH